VFDRLLMEVPPMRTEDRSVVLLFELEPSELAPALACDQLQPFRDQWSFEGFQNACLILIELVDNSVRHGPAGQRITIRLEGEAHMLRGEVIDRGPGFAPPESPVNGWSRGNGLVIVDFLADRWGVRGGGPTSVWFEVDPSATEQ
jgi:hypothetical protein